VASTTPRPIKLMRELIADPQTVISRGSTYANRDNLAPSFVRRILRKYEGTRLGRQELHAELLDDAPGALWQREEMLDAHRVSDHPPLVRIVVAIDPSVSSEEDAADAGIMVGGLGANGHGYLLEDGTTHGSPHTWALAALTLFNKYRGDRIVGEVNNGGEMVELTIRTLRDANDKPIGRDVPYKALHASRGKQARAEPVSSLYEQGRIHHVGTFGELEDELCNWVPGSGQPSPNRLDANVWLFTELMLGGEPEQQLVSSYRR
jgi:phage terminase large subunit-like protein